MNNNYNNSSKDYNSSINLNTFDDVFQSLKSNHTKLFIPLINDRFNKDYSLNEAFELLPTDEYITAYSESDGTPEVNKRITDFIIKIRDDKYLLECQSYNDGSMALRIAEYTFLTARQSAENNNGKLTITMPYYSVIYIRSTSSTPKRTEITYKFPNGELVEYNADNLILSDFTKEEIIDKKLYVLIPFYLLRYESIMKDENVSNRELKEVENDLDFFLSFLTKSVHNTAISEYEYKNLLIYIDMVIMHVTNGNKNERDLVNKMGGNVIITEADKIFFAGKAEGRAEGRAEGMAENQKTIEEKQKTIDEKQKTIEELEKQIEELKKQLS